MTFGCEAQDRTQSMKRNDRTFDPSGIERLESPERRTWLPPAEVVNLLQLEPGMTVADVGAGTGYLSLPIAEKLAGRGTVKAVDFEAQMLAVIRAKLDRSAQPLPVEVMEGAANSTGLPAQSCDRVLLGMIWHELDNRDEVLREMSRILRPGGLLAILDWRDDVTRPPGPPAEHRVGVSALREELVAAGWRDLETHFVGPYSYIVTATGPDKAD
jgi:SAM-dependent methyltransferase